MQVNRRGYDPGNRLAGILRQQSGHHPRQHVTGAASGHAGVAGGVHPNLSGGSGCKGAVAFQDDVQIVLPGQLAGQLHPPRLHLRRRDALQARHLSGVGSEDPRPALPRKGLHATGKSIQPVGVKHHGALIFGNDAANQLRGILDGCQAGSHGQHGFAFHHFVQTAIEEGFKRDRTLFGFRQGFGHKFGRKGCDDRQRTSRSSNRHQTGSHTQSGLCGQRRRACLALRAGKQQYVAEVSLVRSRLAVG